MDFPSVSIRLTIQPVVYKGKRVPRAEPGIASSSSHVEWRRGEAIRRPAEFLGVPPTPAIRHHKRESAQPPPRPPTRADSATPPVNEKARLNFEAGLEPPDRTGFKWRSSLSWWAES